MYQNSKSRAFKITPIHLYTQKILLLDLSSYLVGWLSSGEVVVAERSLYLLLVPHTHIELSPVFLQLGV